MIKSNANKCYAFLKTITVYTCNLIPMRLIVICSYKNRTSQNSADSVASVMKGGQADSPEICRLTQIGNSGKDKHPEDKLKKSCAEYKVTS